ACAAIFGPNGPHGAPDPTITDASPRPDFYFLSLFALLALLPPWTETVILLVGMPLAIALLLVLPLFAGTGEKSWRRRPVAVLSVLLIILVVTTLAALGVMSPWSPVMDAGTTLATPVAYVRGRSPLELQGALVVQNKQCRNCHSLDGEGGRRGPALDGVATRLTRDQLIRQVLQGGGNMPAYGKNLAPAEVNALVAFLETLHPSNQPPARAPVASPLLWLGAPVAPMLRGLPRAIRRAVAAGLAAPSVRRSAGVIAHPAFGWVSFTAAFWAWHTPRLYELALRSHAWHHLEHACFF